MILLIMLSASMVACGSLTPARQSEPCLATKPTGLEFVWREDGVWMRERDLEALLIYIEQLKRCADLFVARRGMRIEVGKDLHAKAG